MLAVRAHCLGVPAAQIEVAQQGCVEERLFRQRSIKTSKPGVNCESYPGTLSRW